MADQIEQAIRSEIALILDRLNDIPADAFAARAALRARKDELSGELSALDGANATEIRRRWSQRAGTKPDPQYHVEQVIPSPGEGGSGW